MSRRKLSKRDVDDQFQAFLKESISSEDSFDSENINKFFEPPKRETKPWWMNDEDEEEEDPKFGTGRSSSGKSFLKKKKDADNSSVEPDEKNVDKLQKFKKKELKPRTNRKGDASMSKDSLDDISEKSEEDSAHAQDLMIQKLRDAHHRDTGHLKNKERLEGKKTGFDTMDEIDDKEQFFRDLERNNDSTMDYSRLNREMSQTETTMSPEGAVKTAATLAALEDIEEDVPPKPRPAGKTTGKEISPGHQKTSMLSKVSLMDSLESTMNTTTSPHVGAGTMQDVLDDVEEQEDSDMLDGVGHLAQTAPETFKTGSATGYMGTNTSQEIEDLHKALREVGMSPTLKQDEYDISAAGDKSTAEIISKILNGDAPSQPGKQRTVEDILKEVADIERQANEVSEKEENIPLVSDMSPHSPKTDKLESPDLENYDDADELRGFDLSPAHGFEQSHTEDTEMYQPVTQVSVKEKKKKKEKKEDRKTKELKRESRREKRSPSRSPSRTDKPGKPKFTHVKSSGYGKLSPPKPPREKHQASTWSPAEVSKMKTKGSETIKRNLEDTKKVESTSIVRETQLKASVESFAHYITNQFSGPGLKYSEEEPKVSASWRGDSKVIDVEADHGVTGSVNEWQDRWQEEKRLNVKLQADAAAQEALYQRKLESVKAEFEGVIFKLKQENFVLSAKVAVNEEEKEGKKKVAETVEGANKDRVERLEREVKEQEVLINGYQQENQRLYNEVKTAQKQSKITEEKMFEENQRLLSDVASLRTMLARKESELMNKGIITSLAAQQQIAAGNADAAVGAEQISQMETELKLSKRQNDNLQREISVIEKTKRELEQHIDQLIREREEFKKRLDEAQHTKPEELKTLEEKYEKEIDRKNRKLKWYAENQDLLDKGLETIKLKDDEIHKLKIRVEELRTETGKRLEENRQRGKEKASDGRKIQDLQRQVKEMEQILRKRYPNSLPTLMMAAAAIPDKVDLQKTPLMQVQEEQIEKLQKELASKDEDNEQRLRAMEQKYNSVKVQFEDRIHDLEHQLSIYKRPDDLDLKGYQHPHTHAMALERELDSMRERHNGQVAELTADLTRLTSELNKLRKTQEATPRSDPHEAEAELRAKVRSLQLELESQVHEKQVLTKSLERLRNEKLHHSKNGDIEYSEKDKRKGKLKGARSREEGDYPVSDKEYKPQAFTDTHISDLVRENDVLRDKIEYLSLERDQQRIEVRKSVAESEAIVRKSKEEFEEQIMALRSSHKREMQRILTEQALEHSASKMAELQSQVDAQEVMVRHLKQQLTRAQVEGEELSILKIRETALQTQISKLQDDLKDAKRNHTPGMKHFEALQDKILQMEKRHEQREKELKQLVTNAKHTATVELDLEIKKWKNVVELKNNEIQKFRSELDSILDVLRLLQKQGVIIPINRSQGNT
ncbi:hypothetical protein ScPMuIL_013098 [Solemya velum]